VFVDEGLIETRGRFNQFSRKQSIRFGSWPLLVLFDDVLPSSLGDVDGTLTN
jgi:hypothetical protein